jgi:hypothetical protein
VKGRGKKWDRLIAGIKADAASGRVVTLITLSVKDMEDTARALTMAELRNVRFTFLGMSFQRLALDAPEKKPAP